MKDESNSLMPDLVIACQEFGVRHPEIDEPQKIISKGSFLYSDLFYLEMSQKNWDVRVLHLQGHRKVLKNRHNAFYRYSNPSPEFYHTVCIVNNDFIVDVSARLLDMEGPSMRLSTTRNLNEEWSMIGSSHDALEAYNNIGIFLKRATIRWQEKEYPERSTEEVQNEIQNNLKLAKMFYSQTIHNTTMNHLVFTEFPGENNIHIDTMNEDWRPRLEKP